MWCPTCSARAPDQRQYSGGHPEGSQIAIEYREPGRTRSNVSAVVPDTGHIDSISRIRQEVALFETSKEQDK